WRLARVQAGEPADAPHPLGLRRPRRERPRRSRAAEKGDELAPLQLIELHSVPSQGPIAGYPISKDQSGGVGNQSKAAAARTGKARMDLRVRLASRSQIKHRYGTHRQQPQNDSRSDVLDPYLVVREPSMMHVHGQPPSGYHDPSNRTHYHIYGR